MIGYAEFKRLKTDWQVELSIQREFDEKETNPRGKLLKHTIGWTISVKRKDVDYEYAYFHVHWAPKEEHSTINRNISAHFKPNHKSPKANNKGNPADLPFEDAAFWYNHFAMLEADWNPRAWKLPAKAKTGWTPLTKRITAQMVSRFRAANNDAALIDLMKNPLYELNRWDGDAWNSYMWWMAGA